MFLALPVWTLFSLKTVLLCQAFLAFPNLLYFCSYLLLTSSSSCLSASVSGESYLGFFDSGDVVESSKESDDLTVLLLSRLLKNSAISLHWKYKVCGQSCWRSLLHHYSTQSQYDTRQLKVHFCIMVIGQCEVHVEFALKTYRNRTNTFILVSLVKS